MKIKRRDLMKASTAAATATAAGVPLTGIAADTTGSAGPNESGQNDVPIDLSVFALERYVLAPEIVLTPTGVQRGQVVAVSGGRIDTVMDAEGFARERPDWPVLRLPRHAIIPGFVDLHLHLGQTFGKALTFGEPSQIWQRIWIPLESSLDPDLAYVSAKWMFLESLRGGFTTIVNFAIVPPEKVSAIHRAARETGIRLVSSTGAGDIAEYPLAEGVKPRLATIDEALRRAERHVEQCKAEGGFPASLCCSGTQGASPQLMAAFAKFCAERGILFQTHANEHFPEIHHGVLKFGKRPIETLVEFGGLGPQTLLHHVTLVSETEIELLRETRTAVSYNPVASMHKGDGVAPALDYLKRGIRMGLGTDTTRCDGFRMLDAAEACQRLTYCMPALDFSCGAGWSWVNAATRGGADAAGLGDETGAIRAGLAADFLILDMDRPEVLPSWDFEWELVRLYNRDQIDAVVIGGKAVMAGGRPVGWDHVAFLRDSLPRAIKAVEQAGVTRVHGPSDRYRLRA
jgi:cytosine/adenosine deaminase-related metal-dependent hydrolase